MQNMKEGEIKNFKGKFQLIQTDSLNRLFDYVPLPIDYKFGYDAINAAIRNNKINGKRRIMVSLNETGQYLGKNLFRIKDNSIFKLNKN